MTDTNNAILARLDAIEARLAALEQPQGATAQPSAPQAPTAAEPAPAPVIRPQPQPGRQTPGAATIMAATAAVALVLAVVYLLKLVHDAGWLGPAVQVAMASATGLALVGAGVLFGRVDRAYAAWLPAVGLVALYLALYGGHLYHGLFGTQAALAGVAAVTLLGIWLARLFDNSAYAVFAVVGVYATPLLLQGFRADVVDLVTYYAAWSLLFSFASVHDGRRITYMLAMLFAVIGFDLAWRLGGEQQWALAAGYQLAQFLVFATTTWLVSVRTGHALDGLEATLHGLALFWFYAVEYLLLREHLPGVAPWAALGSVVLVVLLYLAARRRLGDGVGAAGAVMVSAYTAVVTGHVVFLDLLPRAWLPWAALVVPFAVRLAASVFAGQRGAMVPVLLVGGALFILGFLSALTDGGSTGRPPGGDALLAVYALALYGAWAWLRRDRLGLRLAIPTLYAAHAALLVLLVRLLPDGLAVSVAWGALAVALLLLALRLDDRSLGQSSLLVFVASGVKVLLNDLDGAEPVTRVLVLVVLAGTLYAGGWLYQRLAPPPPRRTGDPAVDEQLELIRQLVEGGLDDAAVVAELEARKVPCLGDTGVWGVARIAEIRQAFAFTAPSGHTP